MKGEGDNATLVAAMTDETLKKDAMDEYDKLTNQLKAAAVFGIDDTGKIIRNAVEEGATIKEIPFEFKWPVVNDVQVAKIKGSADTAKLEGDPDLVPAKTFPAIIEEQRVIIKSLEKDRELALKKADAAAQAAQSTTLHNNEAKQIYDKSIAAIKTDINTRLEKLAADFLTLSREMTTKNDAKVEKLTTLGNENAALSGQLVALQKVKQELEDIRLKFSSSQASVAPTPDLLSQDDKKGEVVRKDGGFVYINLGIADHLKPGVTFSVLPSDAVWRTSDEKERKIKAQLEVYDLTGPHTAKAKIVGEKDSLRDPIQAGDQLFNPAWTPGKITRIAFAGIMDLDGSGIDSNKQFLRLLEAQGVVVDEYLQLRPPMRIQRDPDHGIRIETQYLVLAPDPRVTDIPGTGKVGTTVSEIQSLMGQMKNDAAKYGVQMIEARKFMALMGLKLPNNPSPPFYEAYNKPLEAAPAVKKDE